MSFNLLAFAGGAASAFTEEIDKAEKEAKTYGLAKAKVLYERYGEVEKENKKLESEARADIDMIRAKYTGASAFSDDQLVALAAKPEIRKALLEAANKDYFDPSVLNPAQIVKLKEANPATGTLTERISKMYELPKMMEEKLKAMTPEQKQKLGFFGNIEYKAERAAMERFGVAAGVPIGQMEAALKASKEAKPEMAEFNLAGLGKKPETFDKMKNDAQLAYVRAQESGNDEDKQRAMNKLAIVEAAEKSTVTKDKTEEQIQTSLINKITAETDPRKKALLVSELRTRQVLNKLPSDKEGGEKISQANLITTALGAVRSAQAYSIPQGKYDVGANGEIILRDFAQAEAYRKGTQIGMNSVVNLMTTPDGKPKSEMHRNAMSAAGIQFDREGKAVIPEFRVAETPAAGAAKPAAPAALPQPAAAKPAANVAQLRKEATQAIAKGKDPRIVAKVFKEATGEDL